MRIRSGAGAACLVLAVLFLLSGLLSAVQSPGTAVTHPTSALASKGDQGQARGAQREKDKDKNKDKRKHKNGKQSSKTQKDKQGKDGKKSGRKGGKQAPRSLDARSIAAAAEQTEEAFDCEGLIPVHVGDLTFCTHGDDPPMPDIGAEAVAGRAAAPRALCIDDGQSGHRIQLVYVHRGDRPDRYAEMLPTFRRLASEMDLIFDQSARKTGESLRLRFVTEGCQIDVAKLQVSSQAMQGFGSLIAKMKSAGYGRTDRKYLMLVDAGVYCGVGTFYGGSKADNANTSAHDFTGYARVDTPCWDAGTMAHELSHTLGAVQYSAPHTSGGAHCIDEWDVMCYSDSPNYPKMQSRCKDGVQDFRLDCGNDDYFAADPEPGSYLASHWNVAESPYLVGSDDTLCVDAASEPDDAYWYAFWGVPMREFEVGASAEKAFCQEQGDTDWALFAAKRGTVYTIETSGLAPDVDTQLVLYRGIENGWSEMAQIAVNDDRAEGDPSSAITFTAPGDGDYLVGIAEAQDRAGANLTYTLTIQKGVAAATVPMTLSPSRGKRGSAFSVSLSGLPPQARVDIWWHRKDDDVRLGSLTAGDDGSAVQDFHVPSNAGGFTYQVQAVTDGATASANYKVTTAKKKKAGKGKGKSKNKKGKKHKKGKKGKHGKQGKNGSRQ